jgi:8-oxo-dGTP pyrophosphatase MutT (NUDIX family)
VFVVTAIGYVALIERRRQGLHYWAVPGGGIEPGESPEEAARREVHEELGLDVVLDREVDRQGSQVFYVAHVETELALRLGGPELLRNSSDNSYKPAWVPTEQASTLWLRPRGSASVLAQL